MKIARAWYLGAAVFGVAGVLAAGPLTAQVTVTIDADDIGGVVTGPGGPEAGVWVIAETTDLGTKFAKMVVTDDQGRYALPDLPKAKYKVWVRGYGLVDSAKVDSEPGKTLNLRATPAPSAAAAAEYYPAIYWYSMIKVPEKGEFPGTAANGFNPTMKSQGEFLNLVKTNGCVTCHQLGNKATRTIPKALGEFKDGHEAWTRRIQSGQAGLNMVNTMDRMGTQGTLKMFGDWTDRVAKGELPATKPQRPQGVERNAVVTVWDWSNPKAYLHDATAADKRNPTLNANGLVFGATENSTDMVPVLDPVKNIAYEVKLPVRDPKTPSDGPVPAPSAYFGDEAIWNAQTSPHSLYYDEKGRVWFAARNRPPANPDFCKKGSDHPSCEGVSDRSGEPSGHDVRPEVAEVPDGQHLLPDPPCAVRLRRQQYPMGERGRPAERRGRLDQREDARGDRRRGEVAGLDAVHSRHQRQRHARRVHRAEPAARSRQRPSHQRGVLRRVAEPRRHRLGHIASGYPGYVVRLDRRSPIRPRPRSRKSTKCRRRPMAPAAWTSTPTT